MAVDYNDLLYEKAQKAGVDVSFLSGPKMVHCYPLLAPFFPEATNAMNAIKGFYYMAQKANVPIVVTSLDYKKKEMEVKGVIYDLNDYVTVIKQINQMYNGVTGKVHQNFSLSSET